jgi:hypothetical protein
MSTAVTPRRPTREAVADLRRRALAEMSKLRRQHRHERMWADAESFAELCALTEQFVMGQLALTPNHGAPRCPETREIGPALAHANRAGFLTIGSQPGEGSLDSPQWAQRAGVEGHANDEVLERLRSVFADLRPHRIHMNVQGTYPWRNDYSTHVPVTGRHVGGDIYEVFTHFGARLSRSQVKFIWDGIQTHLIEEILGMHLITIIDKEWGPETLLWERLMQL